MEPEARAGGEFASGALLPGPAATSLHTYYALPPSNEGLSYTHRDRSVRADEAPV